MNLEHLCQTVKNNYHRLKNEKTALLYIRYQFELVAWKRQKLKLGAIVFDLKEIVMAGLTLHQDVEMRYIRQDTSDEDELKIENRLNALKWKWDSKNIIAFLVVFTFAIFFVHALAFLWYQDNLPTIAFRSEKYYELIEFALHMTLNYRSAVFFRFTAIANLWLIDTLTRFCDFYDILF